MAVTPLAPVSFAPAPVAAAPVVADPAISVTPAATYLRGALAWNGEALTGTAGAGRFVPRG